MMPYWEPSEIKTDCKGNIIIPGDILESTLDRANNPWRYFVCFQHGNLIQVRDLNANNVGMCDLGLGGDVVNIGHYTKNLGILNKDDLEYYFDVDENFNRIHPDWDLSYVPSQEELEARFKQMSKLFKSKYFATPSKLDFYSGKNPLLQMPKSDFIGENVSIPLSFKGKKTNPA